MGITEVTVPKQYVIVQGTEPTGAFEGQLWYDSTNDLTYIFQDGDWQQITLDISNEVLELATENAQQQIDIIELQANASVTPFDHDTLISDTFSDADGYKDSVNTDNTDAEFDTNLYKRTNPTDLLTGLVSYFKLDETNGTTATDSLANSNGTITNALVNQPGIINTSYYFDGTSNYVTLANESNFDFLTANAGIWTISMWVKPETINADRPLFSKSVYASDQGMYIRENASGAGTPNSISVFLLTNGSNYLKKTTPANSLTDGVWQLVTIRNNAGTISIDINGQTQALTTGGVGTFTGNNNSSPAIIGAYDSTTNSWKGWIDEIGIWNRVLTADEITTLYNSGAGLSYDNFEVELAVAQTVEIDLPTITGTITHTELVTNSIIETGASITYKLNNGTTDDTEETPNTKNAYNLTGVPTKLKILLNPKETEPTNGNPSIKTYCLKLWKA